MSHISRIKTRIKDPVALAEAVRKMGFLLVENARPRAYGGAFGAVCNLVINLPGPYDVGLTKGEDGAFEIQADLWKGHVEGHLGKGCGTLMQSYESEVLRKMAARTGRMFKETHLEDGSRLVEMVRA